MEYAPVFPNRQQKLFLRAILSDDEAFPKLWKMWKKLVKDYRSIDESTLRLFPMAYPKLSSLLPKDSWLLGVRNAFQYHWMHNSVLFHEGKHAVSLLQKKRIPFLMAKGAAVATLYYGQDLGSRSIEDLDVFVSSSQFFQALKTLQLDGWQVHPYKYGLGFDPNLFASLTLKKGQYEIDLHSHLFGPFFHPREATILFAKSRTFTFMGKNHQTLNASDMLVHVCTHGMKWSSLMPLRWIIDSFRILHSENVDWKRVLYIAETFHVSLTLLWSLEYLSDEFGANIPSFVLEKLRTLHTPFLERVVAQLQLRDIYLDTWDTAMYYIAVLLINIWSLPFSEKRKKVYRYAFNLSQTSLAKKHSLHRLMRLGMFLGQRS